VLKKPGRSSSKLPESLGASRIFLKSSMARVQAELTRVAREIEAV
jgi:hypothetical protein